MSSHPKLTEVPPARTELPRVRPGFWSLCKELRKRKVCRTAISYVLVLWLNLQIGDVIFPMIGLPDWTLSLIIVIGVMGFPVVLILAWAFQVTADGIVLDDEAPAETRTDQQLGTVVNLLLLLSSIVLSALLILQFLADDGTEQRIAADAERSSRVLVSNLSFQSTSEDAAALADGLRNELRHRLINLEGIDLQPESAPVDPEDERQRLALSGSLRLDGERAHILAHLIDLSEGRYLLSISFDLEVESIIAVEAAAADRIVSELASQLIGEPLTIAYQSSGRPRGAGAGYVRK